MRYFATSFEITLRQRLRNIKSWLMLLLVPLLLLGISLAVPPQQVSAPVQVGVVLPEDSGEVFWNLLSERSGTVLTFLATDEETLNRNIATGKWDCGLILAEDFEERIAEADTDKLFTIRIKEGSAVYPLVRETVSSCVVALIRVPMGQKYLAASKIATGMDSSEIRMRLEQVLGEEDRVQITMHTPDGAPMQPFQLADRGLTQFLQWLLAMSLLIWLLLSTCDLGRWCISGAAKRLRPVLTQTAAMLPRLCADSLLAVLSGWLGVLMMGGGFAGLLAVIGYVAFWSGIGLVIARFPAMWQSLPVLPAFAVVTSFLLSSVLVDLSLFLPGVSCMLRYVPGRMYFSVCRGDYTLLLPLLGVASAGLLLSILMDKIKKRCR